MTGQPILLTAAMLVAFSFGCIIAIYSGDGHRDGSENAPTAMAVQCSGFCTERTELLLSDQAALALPEAILLLDPKQAESD